MVFVLINIATQGINFTNIVEWSVIKELSGIFFLQVQCTL